MAITIAGMAGASYDIDAAQYPRIFGRTGGANQHVEGAGWVVTPTGSAREVSIAAGYGYACHVEAYSDAAVTLTAGANTSGSTRYDMVVFTYDWGTPANSAFSIKASTSVVTSLTQTPGTTWEMPVARLTVADGQGAFSTADVLDIRPLGRGSVAAGVASGWTADTGVYPPVFKVSGDTVTGEGVIRRTGSATNLSGSLTIGTIPARLVPPGEYVRVRQHTMVWSRSTGSSTLERRPVPLYTEAGDIPHGMVLWKPQDVTPRFDSSTFVDLSGICFTKGL